jgi:hypothetical protein
MTQKPSEMNPVAISNQDRHIVAKELIGPLDGRETVILTRQIKQSLL